MPEIKEGQEQLNTKAPEAGAAPAPTAEPEALARARAEGAALGQANERARVLGILDARASEAVTRQAVEQGFTVDQVYRLMVEEDRGRREAGLESLKTRLSKDTAGQLGREAETAASPAADAARYARRVEALRAEGRSHQQAHSAAMAEDRAGYLAWIETANNRRK